MKALEKTKRQEEPVFLADRKDGTVWGVLQPQARIRGMGNFFARQGVAYCPDRRRVSSWIIVS